MSVAEHHRQRTGGERFVALWLRCAAGAIAAQIHGIHGRLCAAYGEPWRHYHALAHIEHCLGEFDAARDAMPNPDEVELALWYHDAVYAPGDGDNEKRSAELFANDSAGMMADAQRARVGALILATAHTTPPDDAQAAWVVDIDLSSFGLPWPDFLHDSHAVRAEMKGLDDEHYLIAHGDFLRGLLARPRLYTTDHFHARYEQQARDNIARLLDAYASGVRP